MKQDVWQEGIGEPRRDAAAASSSTAKRASDAAAAHALLPSPPFFCLLVGVVVGEGPAGGAEAHEEVGVVGPLQGPGPRVLADGALVHDELPRLEIEGVHLALVVPHLQRPRLRHVLSTAGCWVWEGGLVM